MKGLEVRSTREDTTENIISVSSQPYLNALFRFKQKTCRKRQVVFLWRVGRLACWHIATKKRLELSPSVFCEFKWVEEGARTLDLRNHNPTL